MIKRVLLLGLITILFFSCKEREYDKKGISIEESNLDANENIMNGISKDSILMKTQPSSLLFTANEAYRLLTVFKINYNNKTKEKYVGSNAFHYNYSEETSYAEGNNWNENLLPGFEAVYGYNMVNAVHFDLKNNTKCNFFEKPVLINTIYYPSFSKDTLNFQPVKRNFYMISVYDEDTNKDSFINRKDIRKMYWFDETTVNKIQLIPAHYSVYSMQYDSANDYVYFYTKLDANKNGTIEDAEEIHVFWVNLKDPIKNGNLY